MIKLYEKPSAYFGKEEYERLYNILDIPFQLLQPDSSLTKKETSSFSDVKIISEEKDKIVYICAYITQEKVKRRPLNEWVKENIIQDIILDIIVLIDKYNGKTPFWAYILNNIKWSEIEAFHNETSKFKACADTKKKAQKCIEKMNEENLSAEEISKLMNMHKSTVHKYMNMQNGFCSLESGIENLADSIQAIETDTSDDSEVKQEVIDRVKSGMTKLERFIIDAYLGQADKRDWKKRTIEICKRRSITAKKTGETIKKFKNAVKEELKRAV